MRFRKSADRVGTSRRGTICVHANSSHSCSAFLNWRPQLRIVIFGAGVQGTVFAVRLTIAGHQVTLIARPDRAIELRQGATIQDLKTMRICTKVLPVLERLPPDCDADMCLVTVRREQIETVLPDLAQAAAISRVVFMVNHGNGSEYLRAVLGRSRTVVAFPGIAGEREGTVIRYLDVPQQHTVVDEPAHDIVSLFQKAGFRVGRVRDMDAWLQRHAVFITAIAGALYENGCDARRLAQNPEWVRRFIVAVREGWAALDCKRVASAPLALRTILCWVPLGLSARYWSRLLSSPRGDIYFARHVRHAPAEMASLADDVRKFLGEGEAPGLQRLLASIDGWRRDAKGDAPVGSASPCG
jgi:2-dehydropantoate 2-reductase